nr:hypothetical protein [Tanacetum cinerariifolium]
FKSVYKKMEDFIPMGSKEEAERYKRKAIRDDLNQLCALVKEYLSIRPASSDKEMKLWVELKRLYEPDPEDHLWAQTQNFMHALVEWKLYELCGVHQVTAKDKEIFMLVEKDYPMRKGLALLEHQVYGRIVGNKMHKAFPLLTIKFPLPEQLSTASEEAAFFKSQDFCPKSKPQNRLPGRSSDRGGDSTGTVHLFEMKRETCLSFCHFWSLCYVGTNSVQFTPNRVLNSFNYDNSLLDNFSPEFETFCDHSEETRSEVDLFLSDDSIPPGIENIADDPEGDIRVLEELLIDDSILSHESFDSNFEDNPSIPRPPPEPPDAETDAGEEIPVVMNVKDKFDNDYQFFMFDKVFSLLPAKSKDTIFDPGISD